MLSKLFTSARNLFNPIPQTNINVESSGEEEFSEMVTTRGQRGRNASREGLEGSGEDSILVKSAKSSIKRSMKARDEDEEVVEVVEEVVATPAKEQKVLPLKEKDEDGQGKQTRVVVEISVSSIPVDVQNLEDKEDAESAEEDDAEKDSEEEAAGLEIAVSESDDGSEAQTMVSPKKNSRCMKEAMKPKHKRFGSEGLELEAEFFSTAKEVVESDEESSGDDAPEFLAAHDALESAQSKARDAAKAMKEQETAIRKKRQERKAVLKKQAESVAKKRKRKEEAEEKLDNMSKKAKEGAEVTAPVTVIARAPIRRSNLPDLLPDEYLQDDSESEELMDLDLAVERKKRKKMKFTDLVENKPKDRWKGSTIYRIPEVRSRNLAPKSSFHARSTKEAWLKRRAGNNAGGSRKIVGDGFFKRK